MAEHLPKTNKHEQNAKTPETSSAESKKILEKLEEDAAEHEQKSPEHDVAEIQKSILETAKSSDEVAVEDEQESSQPVLGSQRQLKLDAYDRMLKKVQRNLRPTEKAFSKVIHKPVVETASNIGGATIARPSGILGGGIAALVGSSLVFFMSKRYGFEYSSAVFFLMFIAGFGAGIIGELLSRLVRRKKHASN